MKLFESIAIYSGLIATIWIFLGVIITGKLYAGFSHSTQFCSELGASGSPTENFRLFSLFCVVICLYFFRTLATSFKNRINVGIYQRISYGAQLVWLSGFSLALS